MSPDFWAEAYAIFSATLDEPAPAQAAFVERRTAGRTDLRREVLALLDSHQASGHFLEIPAEAGACRSRRPHCTRPRPRGRGGSLAADLARR